MSELAEEKYTVIHKISLDILTSIKKIYQILSYI